MKTVNIVFLDYLTVPLNGGADDDEMVTSYFNIDSNEESTVKNIIKEVVRPNFEKYPPYFKQRTKDTLSYYLSTDKVDFERLYNSNLLPFDPPTAAKLFYIWTWEVLFQKDDYRIEQVDDFAEIEDLNEPIDILKHKH